MKRAAEHCVTAGEYRLPAGSRPFTVSPVRLTRSTAVSRMAFSPDKDESPCGVRQGRGFEEHCRASPVSLVHEAASALTGGCENRAGARVAHEPPLASGSGKRCASVSQQRATDAQRQRSSGAESGGKDAGGAAKSY